MKRWKRKELEGSDTRTRVSVAEREIKKPLMGFLFLVDDIPS